MTRPALAFGPRTRRAVGSAAIACFAAAFALTPSEVRSHVRHVAPASSGSSEGPERSLMPIVPRADPFVPRAYDPEPSAGARIDPSPQSLMQLGPLPPNLGASGTPLPVDAPASAAVSAVILGRRPAALLDLAGTPTMVRVGDRFDGGSVAGIDDAGVILQSGRRLPLATNDRTER